MNGADTAWIIVATALVLFMTLPGLALFYGGLVRAQNVLSVLMQCFAIACLMSIVWFVAGYSIAFGDGNGELEGAGKIIGGFGKMFLGGVTDASTNGTIPEALFVMFQMTFAIIYSVPRLEQLVREVVPILFHREADGHWKVH